MVTRRRAPWDGGPRDPGGRPRGAYGVRHDATPASINSSMKGKDAGFALIWPALAPNDPQDQRASRSRRVCRGAGREGRPLLLPLVETFLILVERAPVDNVGSCRCRARGARGRHGSRIGPRPHQRSRPLPSTRRRRSRPRCPLAPLQHPPAGTRGPLARLAPFAAAQAAIRFQPAPSRRD